MQSGSGSRELTNCPPERNRDKETGVTKAFAQKKESTLKSLNEKDTSAKYA
jgi:hypothetical protein